MSETFRTTISLNKRIKELKEEYNINLSKEIRQYLTDKYMSIEMLETKRDELESRKRAKKREKHRLEMEIDDIENRLSRINNKIMQNQTVARIKQNDYVRKKVDGAIARIKDASNKETAVKKNASVLSEEFEGFSKEEFEEVFNFFI